MHSQPKHPILGIALLLLSGFSAAQDGSGPSSAPGAAVVVTGGYLTNPELRAAVIRRIDEQPALRSENISVRSFDHNVYLYGTVTSRLESEQAQAIASATPGASRIYNALGVFGG
jgi:hypothetical protein